VNQRILSTLQDFYHIDKDDQRSVQRAWKRIVYRYSMDQEQKLIFRVDSSDKSLTIFSSNGTENAARMQRGKRTRHFDRIVALVIIVLLVGSMLSVVFYRQPASKQFAGQHTPVSKNTPAVSKLLGVHLGELFLGMSQTDLATLNLSAQLNRYNVGSVLYVESASRRFDVSFKDLTGSNNDNNGAVQLITWGSNTMQTDEGLSIGMSLQEFQLRYQHFHLVKLSLAQYLSFDAQNGNIPFPARPVFDSVIFITDGNGTCLWALFRQQRVVQIVLQSDAAKYILLKPQSK
jgi:hypothetical protein